MSTPQNQNPAPEQQPQPYEPPAIVSRQAVREPVVASTSGSRSVCGGRPL